MFHKRKGKVEVVLTARDQGKVWCLPKGIVEQGEGLKETALREVKEEAGVDGEIVEKIGDVKYWYSTKKNGELVRYFKVVHFYLMKYLGGDLEDHDWEVDEARWVPIDTAIEMASYQSEKDILKKTKERLKKK